MLGSGGEGVDMSFWANIFGTGNVVEKGLEIADEAFYTDQEKADNFGRLMKIYEPFRLVQRILVLSFCPAYVVLHCAVIIGAFFGMSWAHVGVMINEAFGYPVAAAVTLYLGGGVLEGGVRAFNEKVSNK